MSERETWKVGDTLASNKTGARWSYLVVPRTAKVVAVHGKRDVTIRLHGRDERGTRLGLYWNSVTLPPLPAMFMFFLFPLFLFLFFYPKHFLFVRRCPARRHSSPHFSANEQYL